MKPKPSPWRLALAALLLVTINSHFSSARAQGTAFTYQGQLQENGSQANGTYDLTFALYNTNSGGSAAAGPVTNNLVSVTNGLFAVLVDFGSNVFTGTNYWLQIGVESNGLSSFTNLTPRQALTPTPYAIFAEGVNASGISGEIPGTSFGGTYSNVVDFNNGENTFDGTFYGAFLGVDFIGGDFSGSFIGDGSGLINLVNLNASELTSGTVPDARLAANVARTNEVWLLDGNAGTTAGTNFLGTTDNQPLELHVKGQRASRLEPDNTGPGAPNVIGGANADVSGVSGAFIGSGYENTNGGNFAMIGGGYQNQILSTATNAAIGGGFGNAIGAGSENSIIGGGYANTISPGAHEATIAGGSSGTIGTNDINAFIGGGWQNSIRDSGIYGTIGGGWDNVIQGSGQYATVGGGLFNYNNGANAVISGGQGNLIGSNAIYGSVGGGANNNVLGADSTISGGIGNLILTSAIGAVIPGGSSNIAGGSYSFAAGTDAEAINSGAFVWADSQGVPFASTNNDSFNVRARGGVQFVTGGAGMTLDGQSVLAGSSVTNFWMINGNSGTTAGTDFVGTTDNQPLELHVKGQRALRLEPDNTGPGAPNVIGGANADTGGIFGAVIGGGYQNTNGGNYSMIGGGSQNNIATPASNAVISGGSSNLIMVPGLFSTIGGGANNTNFAPFATIPGGQGNSAGASALAAGTGAEAFNQGSFVWADTSGGTIASAANNSVTFRAAGGYRLFSNAGATLGVSLAANGTSWASISDRNAKKNFAPVDYRAVLDKLAGVPIEQWNYKWEDDGDVPNIGPMAQDFVHAFYPGRDDKVITTLEFDGVELAAIQGLNEKLQDELNRQDAENAKLKQQNDSLAERLTELEATVKKLAAQK